MAIASFTRCAAFMAVLCAPAASVANDSTARLDLGGLVFTQSSEIQILEEDLHLSRAEVRVRYRFRNTSDKDITTLVAFPLPPLIIDADTNYSIDARDPVNFIDFRVSVDGQPVSVETQTRATRFGVDVTDVLNRHSIPVTLITTDPDDADVLYQRLNDLPEPARRELEAHGVMDWSSSFGANNVPVATPHWQAEIAFYWQQTFPANAAIEVEHSYRPVPSVFFLSKDSFDHGEMVSQFCVDESFKRAVSKRAAASRYGVLHCHELRYVLTTANNWLGPIGKFTLTIDKGSTDALVSLCIDGIKKTGPTTFVHTSKEFAPEKNLDILFAVPAR